MVSFTQIFLIVSLIVLDGVAPQNDPDSDPFVFGPCEDSGRDIQFDYGSQTNRSCRFVRNFLGRPSTTVKPRKLCETAATLSGDDNAESGQQETVASFCPRTCSICPDQCKDSRKKFTLNGREDIKCSFVKKQRTNKQKQWCENKKVTLKGNGNKKGKTVPLMNICQNTCGRVGFGRCSSTLSDPESCTEGEKVCPNGFILARELPSCEFPACPACPQDVKYCPDGTTVSRVGDECEFEDCPCLVGATKTCPDGTVVGKDPKTCLFEPCPCPEDEECACPEDTYICEDGQEAGRDPETCELFCPCTKDQRVCPDGTILNRDPISCEFPPCLCPRDLKKCPDGTYVGRDIYTCEFPACKDCPVDTPEFFDSCVENGYRVGQECNYDYSDFSCNEGTMQCTPTTTAECSKNGWTVVTVDPQPCPGETTPSNRLNSCSLCPPNPPEPREPCKSEYNIDEDCLYNYQDLSCDGGEVKCEAVDVAYCSIRGDNDVWAVRSNLFFEKCENGDPPGRFQPCNPYD